MSNWVTKPLGEISNSLHRGISYSESTLTDSEKDGLPYINMKSFLKGGGYNKKGLKFFSGVYLAQDLVRPNDVLIANTDVTLDGDIIGVPAILPKELEGRKTLFSHHVTRISISEDIDKKFFYYLLCESQYRRWMLKFSRGTTVLMTDMSALKRIPVTYLEDKKAQQKIATILSTIDTEIEQTEALIAKYQQIKAGLMHDLFTRGVLPNGQLRPPREKAPELYQETAIGWLPAEWGEPVMLESLLASLPNNIRSGPFGSALLKHELVEDGIPFLGIDNIHVERFDNHFRRFVSERKFRELFKYSVRPKDVVITIMGTVGRCCVIPADIDRALSSKHLWTMTFDAERVIPELICWQLNYASWVKAWFRRETQGGIMDAIQSKTLKTLKLPLPSIDEQKLIFQRYHKVSERISLETTRLKKLRSEKLGLMQDLLTGRVPVSVKEPEAPHG